jgi:large subunit ribosomal protein L17
VRHRVYGKHLGRNKNERQALFKGLVHSLLSSGTIQTSEVKAKAIKGLVDKIINSVKKNTFVTDQKLKEKILEILPKLGNKTSGYTSTQRMSPRLGDRTTMVKMSLIGAEEIKPVKKEEVVKK